LHSWQFDSFQTVICTLNLNEKPGVLCFEHPIVSSHFWYQWFTQVLLDEIHITVLKHKQ